MRITEPTFKKLFLDIIANSGIKPANEKDIPIINKVIRDSLNTTDMACDMLVLMSEVIGDD
jgi:hypothetical protein